MGDTRRKSGLTGEQEAHDLVPIVSDLAAVARRDHDRDIRELTAHRRKPGVPPLEDVHVPDRGVMGDAVEMPDECKPPWPPPVPAQLRASRHDRTKPVSADDEPRAQRRL